MTSFSSGSETRSRTDIPEIVADIDGGARGNPGPTGFGVRIERADGTLVEEFCESIGIATNNVAEYRGLIAALEWAKSRRDKFVAIRSDSLLLVQQDARFLQSAECGAATAARRSAAARPRDWPRLIRARPARGDRRS
jgi:probable phosphoglycerate mutase